MRSPCLPVMSAARDGVHTEEPAWKSVSRRPRARCTKQGKGRCRVGGSEPPAGSGGRCGVAGCTHDEQAAADAACDEPQRRRSVGGWARMHARGCAHQSGRVRRVDAAVRGGVLGSAEQVPGPVAEAGVVDVEQHEVGPRAAQGG